MAMQLSRILCASILKMLLWYDKCPVAVDTALPDFHFTVIQNA